MPSRVFPVSMTTGGLAARSASVRFSRRPPGGVSRARRTVEDWTRTAVGPHRTPMNTRILVPVNWTLWAILLALLLYGLVRVSTERTTSPEAGRGLGIFAVLL